MKCIHESPILLRRFLPYVVYVQLFTLLLFRLALFVVGNHMRHHPDTKKEQPDKEEEEVVI